MSSQTHIGYEVIEHVRNLRLPKEGIEYIEQALVAPSRLAAQSRHPSVAARFASTKFGQVVQAESHTCELPFLYAQELDKDVLVCLDQPPPLFIEFKDKRGRLHRGRKTPDFLTVRSEGVYLYECKTHGDLVKFVVDQPANWAVEDGNYRYLPAEAPAAAWGMTFRVHDAGTISAVYAANLRLLVYAKRSHAPCLEERLLSKALRILTRHNGLSLSDLAYELKVEDLTPIIASVLSGQLYVLLRWQLLSSSHSTTVYPSKQHLDLAERAIIVAAEADSLRADNFEAPLTLSEIGFRHVIQALDRIRRVHAGEIKPTRTDYRNMRKLKEAETVGRLPLIALAPKFHLRGVRPCLPKVVEEAIENETRKCYASSIRWSITALKQAIDDKLRPLGLSVSYETVRLRVRAHSQSELAKARVGYRAENASMVPVAIEESSIRASVSWERAHVDSTILDEKIWLQCSISAILQRPTFYLLVDESSSNILAYWVCFGSAGDQAVACLLRDCIRRHRKLPCSILHDRGSEYFSIFSENFTAAVGIDLIRRPSAAPRFGSYVETAFDRINKLIVHRLPGNTQNDKLGRASTAEMRSAAHARHDLFTFLKIIEKGLVGCLDNRPIGQNVATPQEMFVASEKQFEGIVRHVSITPDLLAHTAIPEKKGRLIDNARGIKFKHKFYVGPSINDPSLHGKKVPVRWEPYNPSIIYAKVHNHWERLTCRGYQELENAGHLPKLVELYMRFDTATASKAARDLADQKIAACLHEGLTDAFAPPPQAATVATEDVEPSTAQLFTRARSMKFDKASVEQDLQ